MSSLTLWWLYFILIFAIYRSGKYQNEEKSVKTSAKARLNDKSPYFHWFRGRDFDSCCTTYSVVIAEIFTFLGHSYTRYFLLHENKQSKGFAK